MDQHTTSPNLLNLLYLLSAHLPAAVGRADPPPASIADPDRPEGGRKNHKHCFVRHASCSS